MLSNDNKFQAREFVCQRCEHPARGFFKTPGDICPVCLRIIASGADVQARIANRRDAMAALRAKGGRS
jgi:hypothetical protein